MPRFRPPDDTGASGPLFQGKNIFAWRVKRSGVSFGGTLELALCARWWRYRWEEFEELDPSTQAFLLATYRCSLQIDAILADPDYR